MPRKPYRRRLWDGEDLDRVWQELREWPTEGKTQVVIRRFSESVSDQQRGYYRGVMLAILSHHTGYTAEQMHEWLKKKFGDTALVEVAGEAFDVSTFTTSNQGEVDAMSAFIDEVIQWAAIELDVAIPPPDIRRPRKRCPASS